MPPASETWLASDRPFAQAIARPIARFLRIEAASGAMLLAAAASAVVWANSPWSASYDRVWSTDVTLTVGHHALGGSLRHWINDGLMALFFFVLGLEIRQAMAGGQLASRRTAVVPVLAAVGGMVLPAAIYLAVNHGGPGTRGWGVAVATDVAFSLGVLALVGRWAPSGLKLLLLGLAVVDDIGAIVIIAAFYGGGVELGWVTAAALGLALVAALRRLRVWYLPVYIVIGTAVWFATLESGVHATIAGVALGLLAPARPLLADVDADRIADELSEDRNVTASEVRDISFRLRESVPVAERLAEALHPWTSFVIVPLFALANAGVPLSRAAMAEAVTSRITLGVVAGLVVGKLVGITIAVTLTVRRGWGTLPGDIVRDHILGMAALAGIGFTVSLFVVGLAFPDEPRADQAKVGVLAASLIAATLGAALLAAAARRASTAPPSGD